MYFMFAYLDIMRPHNAAMSIIAVFVGWTLIFGISPGHLGAYQLYFSMIAVFLISGAGNVINDYLDVESDKINKPNRPIPAGRIKKNVALVYAIALFAAGMILAGYVNVVTFLLAIINVVVLIIYSLTLQNKIFLGNISIGYLVGSTFLFGGAATGSIDFLKLPLILMLLSSLTTFTREIIKDLEDIEGDKQNFLKRLSNGIGRLAERFGISHGGDIKLKYNKERARNVAAGSLLLAVFISPVPFFMNLFGIVYLIALIPANIMFLFAFYMTMRSNGKRGYNRISKSIKIGMLMALISFILGIIF